MDRRAQALIVRTGSRAVCRNRATEARRPPAGSADEIAACGQPETSFIGSQEPSITLTRRGPQDRSPPEKARCRPRPTGGGNQPDENLLA